MNEFSALLPKMNSEVSEVKSENDLEYQNLKKLVQKTNKLLKRTIFIDKYLDRMFDFSVALKLMKFGIKVYRCIPAWTKDNWRVYLDEDKRFVALRQKEDCILSWEINHDDFFARDFMIWRDNSLQTFLVDLAKDV